MGYGIIVLSVTIACVVFYVFATEAGLFSKSFVVIAFAISFVLPLWIPHFGLAGLFLRVAICLCVLLYQIHQQALNSGE
jgi:hypothetical protein